MWMDAREKYARLLSDTEGGSGVESGDTDVVTPTPVDPHMQSKDQTWTESAMFNPYIAPELVSVEAFYRHTHVEHVL